MRSLPLLESMWQDVRYALRMTARAPGFTAVVVVSLALGIGANTAVFSLVNSLMLRTLPVEEPQRLVELLQKYPGEPRGNGFWTWSSYEHFRDHNNIFSDLTGFSPAQFAVRGERADAEVVEGEYVAPNYFSTLGIRPAVGRLIGQQDDRQGTTNSLPAVVSWDYWNRRFNRSAVAVGRQIVVGDVPLTVVGVTPRDFRGLATWHKPDVWVPAALEPLISGAGSSTGYNLGLALVGILKPGVPLEQARAEMSVLYQFTIEQRAQTSPNPLVRQMRIEVEPAGTGLSLLRDQFARPALLLMTVVSLLLLITCTNVASLLLARATARQSEMALRVSLGAGRWRLVRQALTESLLLSVAGALAGLWLAYLGAGALVNILLSGRLAPALSGRRLDVSVHPDAHVLLFTMGVAVLTSLLFGLAPSAQAWAADPASSLSDARRTGSPRARRFFWRGLVVTQVACSVVLLSAAGLFARHLSRLEHIDLGFRRDHLLLVKLEPVRKGMEQGPLLRQYQDLLERFRSIPGVEADALSGASPISGAGASRFANVEGHPERPEDRRYLSVNWVAPDYFATLGTPLLAGRDFKASDEGSARVAIINRSMAHFYFGDASAVGRHFQFDNDDKPYEIVGVVGDSKYYDITEATHRTIYLDAFQDWHGHSQFTLRTSVPPSAVASEVRRTVANAGKTIAIARMTTMDQQVDASIVPERLIATLSGVFGAIGAGLAAIGIYGLLAYTVVRRISEIGIRLALGATRGNVTWMVLKDALLMVCGGLAMGVPLTIWASRFGANLIQEQPLTSALPMAFGAVAIFAVALIAAFLPARRAALVEPMEALRHE